MPLSIGRTVIDYDVVRRLQLVSSVLRIGPRTEASKEIHASKYRQRGESFDDYCVRYARTTADDEHHFRRLLHSLRTQATLPGGRQQRAVGYPFQTTAFNCFVGPTIEDDTRAIGDALTDAMLTLRSGGGCGWDFSTLRPERFPIHKLGDDAYASGPVSFMGIWHAMCHTIRSAGERRGAMMGVLNVHHPDILTFIRAKQDQRSLTNFNISVGVTREFMEAVETDTLYELRFPVTGPDSRVIRTARARDVWAVIMENNWDWAEPGVLFLDTINEMNPLWYCEYISATNPCGEEPLPPGGACLLLSHNIPQYLVPSYARHANGSNGSHTLPMPSFVRGYEIDYDRFYADVCDSVRACDNVFESTTFPLDVQRTEALAKRRMGVGVTGVANALEICGHRYGTDDYIQAQDRLLSTLQRAAITTSCDMARVKGTFPLFNAERWLESGYAKTLPDDLRHLIRTHGLRNGLLTSIAPTGTISFAADNVSSGIEAPYDLEVDRTIQFADGPRTVRVNDWALEEYGVRCRTALETPPLDHVKVLCAAQRYIDSAISKTINVRGAKQSPARDGESSFADFKDVYRAAYEGGAKGCATFNINGKRAGILQSASHSKGSSDDGCHISSNGERVCTGG